MGYTVTVQPRNPKLLKKMLEFGRKNFRRMSQLTGAQYDYASELREGKDLSYDHSPKRIGFDYNSGAPEREYVHALCNWMAIRVGTRKNGIPRVRYDGYQWFDVEPERFDEHGWWKLDGLTGIELEFASRRARDFEHIVKPELVRLSELWKKQEDGTK